ncbi:MAG: hypothetical protein ACP5F3_08135, partial [Candidatus Syntrophosphaera sp.]
VIILLLLMLALPLAALPKGALLGMSALLPGTGEIALGRNTRGAVLLGADVLAFTSLWATNRQKDDLIDSYERYATVYAGIPEGMDEQYYQHIQEYVSSDEFNQFQELNARNYYLIYTYDPEGYSEYMAANTYDPSEAWEWQSEQHQDHYDKLRRDTQTTKMYVNLSLGAIILNRVISVIDVALLSRDRQSGHTLYFSPDRNYGLTLNYRMEF